MFEAGIGKVVRGQAEVVGQRNTDQTRADDEDEEGRPGEHFPGVDHEESTKIDGLAFGWRRCVGEREAIEAEDDCADGADFENVQAGAPADEADEEAGSDPADRAPDADLGEFEPGEVGESDRVAEAERRHVAEHVTKAEIDHEGAVAGGGGTGGEKEEDATEEEENAHDDLRGKKAVCNESEKEGSEDGSKGGGSVGSANEVAELVGPKDLTQGGKPGSPDEELEEHHEGEAGDDGGRFGVGHGRLFGGSEIVGDDEDARRG